MHRLETLASVAIGLALLGGTASAVPVDGVRDPEYGFALSTQITQTNLGDQPDNFLYGSELDEAYGYVAGDTLHLLLTGSFNRYFGEPLTLPNPLHLYIDDRPGGQNTLGGSNPDVGAYAGLESMTGLRFDAAFSPDFWLYGALEASGPRPFFAYYAELPAGGGGTGYWLGSTGMNGPGTLSGAGANNPFGILASIDVSNSAGVTAGCAAASGAGVTTGIEWAIPLAAIGNPSGTIKVCALLVSAGPSGVVSNQVLGPVPPGTCSLGPAPGVDFESVPGLQYFLIDAATPVRPSSWGRLKAAYR
jgi:hypothetical protein